MAQTHTYTAVAANQQLSVAKSPFRGLRIIGANRNGSIR